MDNHALRFSCYRSHGDVARWLVRRFKLTEEDARADHNFALYASILRVQTLPIAMWLADRFKFTKADMKTWIGPFQWGIRHDFVALKWVVERFKLDSTDMLWVFPNCCFVGEFEAVCWLETKFELTTDDIRRGLDAARESGDVRIIEWLENKFGDRLGGCRNYKHLYRPFNKGDIVVVKWKERRKNDSAVWEKTKGSRLKALGNDLLFIGEEMLSLCKMFFRQFTRVMTTTKKTAMWAIVAVCVALASLVYLDPKSGVLMWTATIGRRVLFFAWLTFMVLGY